MRVVRKVLAVGAALGMLGLPLWAGGLPGPLAGALGRTTALRHTVTLAAGGLHVLPDPVYFYDPEED